MRAAVSGAVIGALLCSAPAMADMTVYYHVGSWDAFSGPGDDGKPVCGVGSTNPTDHRSISIRYTIGSDTTLFQAKKPTWNIPQGTQVAAVMQLGLDSPWNLQAVGNRQIVEWSLDRDAMQLFDAQFRRGSSMTLTFPQGNEAPWTVGLNGSTAISNAFGRCVRDMMQRTQQQTATPAAPTQPYSQAPAQAAAPPAAPAAQPPAQPQATQPFGTQKP
jgi:hypothetical protein